MQEPLFDIKPLSKYRMKKNRDAYTLHVRSHRLKMLGATSAPLRRRGPGVGKHIISQDSNDKHYIYSAAWQKITSAMNRPDAIVYGCPHCEFSITKRVVIHRDPFPPIILSFEHRCPPKTAGWLEITHNYSPQISYELAREIACGSASLWNMEA